GGPHASIGANAAFQGSSLRPGIGRTPYLGKSTGFWKLEALSLEILGWEEFSVRFWPALAGLGLAAAAALAVRRGRVRGARLAAVICGTSLLGFAASQLAAPHALYACLVAFALAGFVRAWDDRRYAVLAHAAAALAFIVHGPEGILLPWLCLYLYSALTDDPGALTRPLLYGPGAAVTVLLALGYMLLLRLENPMALTLMLYRTPAALPVASFALPVLAVGSLPWTGFLLRAAAASWPRSGEDLLNPEGPRLLLLTGAGVFLLFGVFMGDALALVSCLAPLAALTGDCIDEWLDKDRVRVLQGAVALNLICLLLALTVGLLLLLGAFPVLSSTLLSLVPWAVFLTLFGAASWYYARTRQPSKMMRNLSAAAMLALLPLAGVFDLLAENTSMREAGLALRGAGRYVLAQYAMNRPSLFFYTLEDSVSINGPLLPGFAEQKVENDTALHLLWEGKERVLLLIGSEQPLIAPLPQEVNVLYDAGRLMVLSNRKPPLRTGALQSASSADVEPARQYRGRRMSIELQHDQL
ncbi:MAG: hypothetical protein ACFNW0_05160, partial [Fretibacterium sp.]